MWPKHTNREAIVDLMRAEYREGIGVQSSDNGLGVVREHQG